MPSLVVCQTVALEYERHTPEPLATWLRCVQIYEGYGHLVKVCRFMRGMATWLRCAQIYEGYDHLVKVCADL